MRRLEACYKIGRSKKQPDRLVICAKESILEPNNAPSSSYRKMQQTLKNKTKPKNSYYESYVFIVS